MRPNVATPLELESTAAASPPPPPAMAEKAPGIAQPPPPPPRADPLADLKELAGLAVSIFPWRRPSELGALIAAMRGQHITRTRDLLLMRQEDAEALWPPFDRSEESSPFTVGQLADLVSLAETMRRRSGLDGKLPSRRSSREADDTAATDDLEHGVKKSRDQEPRAAKGEAATPCDPKRKGSAKGREKGARKRRQQVEQTIGARCPAQ